MRRQAFHHPPARPPPVFNPTVENWLEGLPHSSIRLSSVDLGQWNRDGRRDRAGGRLLTGGIILRVSSLTFAAIVAFIALSILADQNGVFAPDRLVPALVVVRSSSLSAPDRQEGPLRVLTTSLAQCPLVVMWNAAELIMLGCLRRGEGISPIIHVWVDGALFLGAAITTGFMLVDVVFGIESRDTFPGAGAREIVGACFLIAVMIIHSFYFFFFICNKIDRRERERKTLSLMTTTLLPEAEPPAVLLMTPYAGATKRASPTLILAEAAQLRAASERP
ncbi:hypothetical protein B0T24DRAFT_415208 [Lasiosphaeria ovina]|uniref:Uncharacterized protein n=1 Tax=Lasiosphaeria ovina TaxID=92902 RepID=A0AAE0JXG2_9PEZI|nr:hypothetical protein B0T24DRAFT_415208 [Lasiosphaeria ovina]